MGEIKRASMKRKILIATIALILIAGIACALLYTGIIHINNPSKAKYPVRGVDVSHYQGEIDWKKLSGEGISFAYIKATEGSSAQDRRFEKNWNEAKETGLRIGAYHFFSLDSAGLTQAENFCKTVPAVENMLPPVVDVEPYGGYQDPAMLDKEKMLSELGDFLDNVEAHYSLKPVIYTTEKWLPVVQERFANYDIWIRSVYKKPNPSIDWTFWQYSNRHVLQGYSGDERYIDMNVFKGTIEEFNKYYR